MASLTTDLDSTTTVLRIDQVSVNYDEVTALSQIDLTLRQGDILAVFGESGSGKSVLFRCLAGLERPSRGRIFIQGQDLYAVSEQKRLGLLRTLGVAHQTGALLKSLSVFENILLPLKECGDVSRGAARQRVNELLQRFEMQESATLYPSQLSRGEVKRVALARALALKPQIVICDDIFSGLSWSAQLKIFDLFKDYSKTRGMSFIFFTPAPEVSIKAGQRLLLLDRGQVIASGRPDEILRLTDPAVERVFHSHLRAFQQDVAVSQRSYGEAPPEQEANP